MYKKPGPKLSPINLLKSIESFVKHLKGSFTFPQIFQFHLKYNTHKYSTTTAMEFKSAFGKSMCEK